MMKDKYNEKAENNEEEEEEKKDGEAQENEVIAKKQLMV
jgi:hypothetical protein